jgi:hypothetical protein
MDYAYPSSLASITNEAITDLCQDGTLLSAELNSTKVVLVLPDIVVKFGIGVHQQEATTLDYAYHHANSTAIRVPQVFRFFTNGKFAGLPFGYIVMEHITGVNLEQIATDQRPDLITRVANAMNHLSQIPIPPQQTPGPVDGGAPRGYLWTDYGACASFGSLRQMEDWLNRRLDLSAHQLPRLDLSFTTLAFSHMDIARRNIILTTDDEICFVDWAFAGFYPPFFQRFCLEWCSSDSTSFVRSLLDQLPDIGGGDQDLLLGEILRINSMYLPPALLDSREKAHHVAVSTVVRTLD